MTRPRAILLFVATILAAGAVIYLTTPKEPRYQGRTLSAWLKDARVERKAYPPGQATAEWLPASFAVEQIGTNAIPWLLKWALAKDSQLKLRIAYWVNSHPFLDLHMQFANDKCWDAACGLKLLGDKANAAKPVLEEWTHSSDPERRIRGYFYLTYSEPSLKTRMEFSRQINADTNSVVNQWRWYTWANRSSMLDYELFPDVPPAVLVPHSAVSQTTPNK